MAGERKQDPKKAPAELPIRVAKHIKSLGLSSLSDYLKWCAAHGLEPSTKKSWDQLDREKRVYPPSQKATGVNPWMNARWVPSVALAKEGTLRRVPPDEACGEVPRP